MVKIPSKPATIVEQELPVQEEDLKVKAFKDTIEFPSVDSFLDFDSCNWLGSNRNIEEFSIEDKDFDFFEDMEMGLENHITVVSESLGGDVGVSKVGSESVIEEKAELCGGVSSNNVEPELCERELVASDNSRLVEGGALSVDNSSPTMSLDGSKLNNGEEGSMEAEVFSVVSPTMSSEESKLKKVDENLAGSIEEGLGKVSLKMDDDEKSDGGKGKSDSGESDSDTSSSSSSSGDSSSSDEEGSDEEESDEEESKKEKNVEDHMVIGKEGDVAGELEEGEIESGDEVEDDDDDDDEDDDDDVNDMVAWSNDEDEDFGLQTKEPIRSKNELKELPPVPAVDVTLEPHHVTLPVGVVSSVMSTQVIVEGMEKHNPLTEGSILWITERRTPLGLVDEIFGPVKSPYYIVRFNSESEVPEGISQGTPVSFVADYAQHILNIKELQKKGYDASGDNDEEIPDELEFSDDEKEAQHKRMQKKEKRGMMNDKKTGNSKNKKKKNRDQGRPSSSYSGEWAENQGSTPLSSNHSESQMGGPSQNHQPRPQMDGFSRNGGTWRPQSNQQIPYQRPPIPNQMGMPNPGPMQHPLMGMQNQNHMMFQPQFNGGQMPMPMPMPSGQGGLNFFPGPGSAPWHPLVGQSGFNQQPFGMFGGVQHPQLPNELLNFNMFGPQGFQMNQPRPQMPRPQFPMNPQFQMQPQFQTNQQSPMNPQPQFQTNQQSPMNPHNQMLNRPPQSPINPQFQMQPQSETHSQSQISQSPTNSQSPGQPQSQGFSTGQSSEGGRGHSGRGRGRGRGGGRFRGRGRRGRGRSG